MEFNFQFFKRWRTRKNVPPEPTLLELASRWSKISLEQNRIIVERNIVKVFHTQNLYTAITHPDKVVSASWQENEVEVLFENGNTKRYDGLGSWEPTFIKGNLTKNDQLLTIQNSRKETITISTESRILFALWVVWHGRPCIRVRTVDHPERCYLCQNMYEPFFRPENLTFYTELTTVAKSRSPFTIARQTGVRYARLKELNRGFFSYKKELLYLSNDFIGLAPTILHRLTFHKPEPSGTIEHVSEFSYGEGEFRVICTKNIEYGPIRGYQSIVVFRNGIKIIDYTMGGRGHGRNFSNGTPWFFDGNQAWLVERGSCINDLNKSFYREGIESDRYYLFSFDKIIIPEIIEDDQPYSYHSSEQVFHAHEIECFRRMIWKADFHFDGHSFHVERTLVDGFYPAYMENGEFVYKAFDQMAVLHKTCFWVDNHFLEVE